MKIIKNTDNFRNSNADYNFFVQHYKEVFPIKKLTVFFDSENFLFTNYDVDMETTFVAESWNGNQIHLSGLNCGYGGNGPSRTADVLKLLGFDNEEAYRLKFNPGLLINFTQDGKPDKNTIIKSVFFSRQLEHTCQVRLDKMTYVDMVDKEIFIVNPQLKPVDLYNIIDKLHPSEMQYYLGNQESETIYDDHIPYENIGGSDVREDKYIIGVNLILFCQEIKVMCLVDYRTIMSVVDMLYYYIFRTSLFDDSILIRLPKSRFKAYLLSLSGGKYRKFGQVRMSADEYE